MKSIELINQTLNLWGSTFGLPVANSEQGSDAWRTLKLGVISASNASKAVAKKGTDTRDGYMAELVAQVCTGIMGDFDSKAMEWGRTHEDAARANYEFMQNVAMTQLPFVFKDETFRVGCSPDGIVSEIKGAEIKCPFNTMHFIRFMADERLKPEYQWQTQFTMWVLGAGEWDVVQFDPRMKKNPIHVITIARDEEKMRALDDLIPAFIYDMDQMLKRTGFEFGEQWQRGDI